MLEFIDFPNLKASGSEMPGCEQSQVNGRANP
jgi:hypothetical protein